MLICQLYVLYANNVSLNNMGTMTPESLNYKNVGNVFIKSLKKTLVLFYRWIQGWNDGYLAIKLEL